MVDIEPKFINLKQNLHVWKDDLDVMLRHVMTNISGLHCMPSSKKADRPYFGALEDRYERLQGVDESMIETMFLIDMLKSMVYR